MTNIVIQQIKIADYKNIFLMPITSNYRLIIILMDHRTNENCLVSEEKVILTEAGS